MTWKKIVALICVLAILFVVFFTVFYCRPLTLEQLSPGFDWDNVSGMAVQADENVYVEPLFPGILKPDHYLRNYYGEFAPGDDCFDAVASILQDRRFRRTLLPAKAVDFLGTDLWMVTLTAGDGSQSVTLTATEHFSVLSAPGTTCTLAIPTQDNWGSEILQYIHTYVEFEELFF